MFGGASNPPPLRAIAAQPQFAAGDVDTGFVDRELEVLNRESAPSPEALLLAASVALDDVAAASAGRSPWSGGDAWRAGGTTRQSIGLRTPSFRRLRAWRRDGRIEIDADDLELEGKVQPAGTGRYTVDAGSGTRELEMIRHRGRLQIVGADAVELTLAPAWPYERGGDDADAHPASPLPGRVVELRVKAGDTVVRGDVLAVVEGMKMQHAIRAGRAGRVTQVLARAGELVDADRVLFDIE